MRLVGHGEVAFVHLADASAGDGAAKAGLVGNELFFAVGLARRGHGFGRNILGTLKLVVAMVARGQCTHLVDHVHQHLGAIGGQALAGNPVFCEDFFLLGNRLHEGLGVVDIAHALGASHGNCLEVFAAHDRAHTRAAGRPVQVIDHRCVEHAVFAGLADARHAGQRVLQALFEHFLGLPDTLAPQVSCIAQFSQVVIDIKVHRRGAAAFENDHVPAGHFELGAPVAARIGAGNSSSQRALGDDGVAPASRSHGAGQGAGGPDDLVGRRQRVDGGVHLFDQVFGTEPA